MREREKERVLPVSDSLLNWPQQTRAGLGWHQEPQPQPTSPALVARVQALTSCSDAFPGALTGSWITNGASGALRGTLTRHAGIASSSSTHCTTVAAPGLLRWMQLLPWFYLSLSIFSSFSIYTISSLSPFSLRPFFFDYFSFFILPPLPSC